MVNFSVKSVSESSITAGKTSSSSVNLTFLDVSIFESETDSSKT